MSACLTTFILKGPKVLPRGQINKAVAQANLVISFFDQFLKQQEQEGACWQYLVRHSGSSSNDKKLLYTVVSKLGVDIADCESLTKTTGENVVLYLFDAWGGRYGDSDWRDDPDARGQILFVAGDMSYGDTPGGGAYKAIEAASITQILHLFRIR